MKPWFAIVAGTFCACAGQSSSRQTRQVESNERDSNNSAAEVRIATTPNKATSGVDAPAPPNGTLRDDETEEAEPRRSVEEIRRCPDPYGGEGIGWTPKPTPNDQATRAMNERHGLVCAERPARAQQLADGISKLWGCTDKRGTTVVPFVYSRVGGDKPFYFTESGLALVYKPGEGWLYIDVNNRTLGQAETMDDMPDEEFGGYARFRSRNGKIGYLDQDRRLAIPARYDAALPFANCTAQVCVGCHPDRWRENGRMLPRRRNAQGMRSSSTSPVRS